MASRSKRVYRIYVIEIDPRWHDLLNCEAAPGCSLLYVGCTGKEVAERYEEHLTGKVRPGRKPKKHSEPFATIIGHTPGVLRDNVDVRQRFDLAEDLATTGDWEESKLIEEEARKLLRSQGHDARGA